MPLPPLLHPLRRTATRALAAISPMFLSGCDFNFWRMDGPQSTIVTEGPVARSQLELFYVTCWVTLVIFVLVGGVLAYATWKFRARGAADEQAEPPPQGHGNPLVEVGLIAASVFALVVIAIPTLKSIWYTYEVPEADKANAYEITARGYQWWFKFEYPNEQIDGVGMLVTGNELVIPAGRPVRIQVRGEDVIHSFWVPKLAGKVDMIPNRGSHLWLQADKPGYFWGQCAEFCGDSHAVMRFRVIALGEKDFKNWLTAQKAPARTVTAAAGTAAGQSTAQFASYRTNEYGFTAKWAADAPVAPLDNWQQQQFPLRPQDEDAVLIAKGRKLFQEKTCIGCHTIRGHEGVGVTGPNLTHVGARTTIAAGLLENNPAQLARWLRHPNEVKPGNKMYYGGYQVLDSQTKKWKANFTLTDDDITALVAYLSSLK
ncbi:MAG: cytochrome c oxidase subunit II [Opitutaceae bacterium]|nr:cytochrome c oxidase subunit II [Opitutaceae bacterium]